MATTNDYIEFVIECLYEVEAKIRYTKMFGEYCVYANDKPIMLVCDNTVFVKQLPAIAPLMEGVRHGFPFPGAKPYYILDIEDTDLVNEVVRLLEENTPVPKPKKRKSKKE